MTRTASVIAFTIGMVLMWGFPVLPVAAEPIFVWGTPVLIETGAGVAEGAQVAVDPQGNAVAVWHQRDGTRFDLWANRFVPGVGWGTAELIATEPGIAVGAQVAVDPQGNGTVVWTQWYAARSSIWANRFVPGIGWGTAELIEIETGIAVGGLQVAVDPQGNATAVWGRLNDTRSNIWANRFVPGIGWGTAELIETGAGDAFAPQIAVDSQGNGTAVWTQNVGPRFNIWANRFVPGVGWGTAEVIFDADGGATGVAVDSQGNAVAVGSQPAGSRLYNIWANRFVPGVGWGTAELIETNAEEARFPRVAVAPQGNATVVWDQSDGTFVPGVGWRSNIWANRFVPGVGWGTAELIETDDAGTAEWPQVAVDPQGNATVVWDQSDGIRSNIWANRFVPGVGWGTAELIETDDAGTADRPHVAVDPRGNATVVWDQSDGTRSNIWANRFAEDTAVPDLVFTSPVEGDVLTSTLVTVTGTASDDLGVRKVELKTDRVNWRLATGTTSWSGTLHLAEGPNIIFGRAIDVAGKTATVTIAVTVDLPPTVAITSPADGASLNSTSVVASGTAFDNEAVDRVELSLDGMTYVLATGTTSWSGTLILAEGLNTIFARATDTLGSMATDTITVTVDTVTPMAVAGEDQTVNAGDTVFFDASASLDDVAIVGYGWDFGDGTTGTGQTATHIYTDPGAHTVTLTVRDAAGNADTDVLIVTVNLVSPEVVALGALGAILAVAAGVALLLWRRRAGGKGKG